MVRRAGLLAVAAVVLAGVADAQDVRPARMSETGWVAMGAPSGCTSGSVAVFLGSPVTLGCDAGITYDAATDTLAPTNLAAGTLAKKGTGTASGRLSVVLHVNTTKQATTGTSEQVLATYTLPANTLSEDGKAIRIKGTFTTDANSNSKGIRIRFGGSAGELIISRSATDNNLAIVFDVTIVRTGAATQIAFGTLGPTAAYTATTQTLSNALDIVAQATTGTAAGDVTFRGWTIEALN